MLSCLLEFISNYGIVDKCSVMATVSAGMGTEAGKGNQISIAMLFSRFVLDSISVSA